MKIRSMLMGDAEFMLQLKNDPQTREFAIASHDEIKMEDHIKWLEKNFLWFYIIEGNDGIRVGAYRIFGNEISIWIDRQFWGLGIATEVIKRVSKQNMIAKIVNGNVGSFRAFVHAGFIPVVYNEEKKYYILKCGS